MTRKLYWGVAIIVIGFIALQIYLHIDLQNYKDKLGADRIKTETPTTPDVVINNGTPIDVPEEDPIQPIEPHEVQIAEVSDENRQQGDNTSQEVDTFDETDTDIPVSPYGFGPYPEVPEGFLEKVGTPIWIEIDLYDMHDLHDSDDIDVRSIELIDRVLIKLWQDDPGTRTYMEGGYHRNGKVYVNYSNRAYVRYKTIDFPDGTKRRVITSWTAGSLKQSTPDPANPFKSNSSQIPNDIELIDLDKEDPGINPYDFLGL